MLRRAFTLVELLLVLAILVVLAAAAAPALLGVLQDQRLKSAADQVRVELTRAHVVAMKSGKIQVFRYELGGERYLVQPWAVSDEVVAPSELNRPRFGPPEEGESGGPRLDLDSAQTLPEGVRFIVGDAQAESRSLRIEEQIDDANRFEGNWSRPVLFYPDGSSSAAFLVLANEREAGIQIELQALTGSASVSEILDMEEFAQ
jgi:prepilin-type N-terminal cleavage/methylation domain-containing protein